MSERDPGLQPERTALAWRRTALSAAVAAAVLLRTGLVEASALALTAGFGALAVVVIAGRAGLYPRRTATPRVLLALSAATSLVGTLAAGHLLWR
ncbi:DUF202 domain-containing protein [Amycolatopsis sp. NPDC004169]|uniref:DUF202 domain-containing protein n=1 Tax=Amycolatopsis sp. NPDC004169 TaxID=3154453 RepID=UPI0033B8A35C